MFVGIVECRLTPDTGNWLLRQSAQHCTQERLFSAGQYFLAPVLALAMATVGLTTLGRRPDISNVRNCDTRDH
ncbi:hypothetical protein HRbin36_02848 [bacterium HR36]|nr:hypothetical protein HRbin36_02848 [bacterium HR36]